MTQKRTVFLFSHIPKTGGTTLRIHFQKHLKDQEEFVHLANRGDNLAIKKGLLPFHERPQSSRKKVKVILGHKVNFTTKRLLQNTATEEIVFFRNPVDWEISRYNQYVNRLKNSGNDCISFQFWVHHVNKFHSQFDWFLSNYLLLGPQIKKLPQLHKQRLLFYVLDNFKHVCLLDSFKEKTKYFFQMLNIPENPNRENVAGQQKKQFFNYSKANKKLLKSTCQNDMLLFKKIQSLYG